MADPAPFGSWPSSFTSEVLVENVVRLSEIVVDGDDIYWNEGRPSEGGRQVIVRRRGDGTTADALGETFGARTLVHEYGGQSYAVAGGNVFFSNFADQRLYRVAADSELGQKSAPQALTAESSPPMSVRFADPVVSPDGRWVVCVRERHLGPSASEVVNDIVGVPTTGGEPVVLVEGHDFFAAPRLSPDGGQLCWLAWDHPRMPWDGTELWVAPFDGARLAAPPTPIAGGPTESVSQPRWSPDGGLHYVSDRTGWWNLYDADGSPLWSGDVDFSGPDWVFGQSTYAFMPDGAVVAAVADRNLWGLYLIRDGAPERVDTPWTMVSSLHVLHGSTQIVALVGSPTESRAVATIDITTGSRAVLRRSRSDPDDERLVAVPEPVEFPTESGTAHAFFYAPVNPNFTGMPGELPPLIVMSHGGPTSAAQAVLDVGLQYWTSRGFAVVDVNYGGSTGYGRAYRERLNGRWGIVDVDDCVNAAAWLAEQGRVDGGRMVIRGQSAGGYTTLSP